VFEIQNFLTQTKVDHILHIAGGATLQESSVDNGSAGDNSDAKEVDKRKTSFQLALIVGWDKKRRPLLMLFIDELLTCYASMKPSYRIDPMENVPTCRIHKHIGGTIAIGPLLFHTRGKHVKLKTVCSIVILLAHKISFHFPMRSVYG